MTSAYGSDCGLAASGKLSQLASRNNVSLSPPRRNFRSFGSGRRLDSRKSALRVQRCLPCQQRFSVARPAVPYSAGLERFFLQFAANVGFASTTGEITGLLGVL